MFYVGNFTVNFYRKFYYVKNLKTVKRNITGFILVGKTIKRTINRFTEKRCVVRVLFINFIINMKTVRCTVFL